MAHGEDVWCALIRTIFSTDELLPTLAMVRSYANVIIPLVLAFAVGVLVYLYGTSKSQFHSAEEELKEIKKDLADARGEKESLRYELDTLTDELEQLSKDKKEALQRAEAAEENAHKANNDMVCTIIDHSTQIILIIWSLPVFSRHGSPL